MEKSATLNFRLNPTLKREAEFVLDRLGVPLPVAVNMFLHQIVLRGGIPFSVTLPRVAERIGAVKMENESCMECMDSIEDALDEADVQAKANQERLPHEAVFDGVRRELKGRGKG